MIERGKFITIEGGEGVGKTTQTKMLVDYLQQKSIPAIGTREPGGVLAAEKIRQVILEFADNKPLLQLFLFNAARYEFLNELVIPNITAGTTVVSDRFADSTVVYQGIVQGVPLEHVLYLQDVVVGNFKPDITFLLDMPVDKALERLDKRSGEKTFFDQKNIDFHQKLRQAYLQVVSENKDRIIVIDANCSVKAVHEQIVVALEQVGIVKYDS